jgi:hypothetical protein
LEFAGVLTWQNRIVRIPRALPRPVRPRGLALAGRPYFQRLRADRSGFQVRPTDGNTRPRGFKASTGTSR